MSEPKISPFGTWKSPITASLIASGSISLGQMALDGQDIYWTEGRPMEGGRAVIVRRTPDGKTQDINPAPYNARSRVHEYGGGAYTVQAGTVYFVNFADQRLYGTDGQSEPQPLTPEAAWRYADLRVDTHHKRLVCVREDHTQADREAINTLVSIPLQGGEQTVLASGNDFYASPRLSPNGRHLAWLTWNHPNMPWDGTELWMADIAPNGMLEDPTMVAGGLRESIYQPEWSPDNLLYFVSDRTGWWNLYRWDGRAVDPLLEMDAEFGHPQWGFDMSCYGFTRPDQLACLYTQNGAWALALLDPLSHDLQAIEIPYSAMHEIRADEGRIVLLAASPQEPYSVVHVNPHTNELAILKRSSKIKVDPGYLSTPQSIEFPTEDGLKAYGLFYPPRNKDFRPPHGEKPPLIVISHGGPTSSTDTSLKLSIQYWTSRGFAVLDVNYGGSTGYGRPYRERLTNAWGIVDVDDCANGAQYLVEQGEVDGERLAIRGGSAGGYTTLAALAFRDVFKAGASYFGVSDLEALATGTHKFESRYLDKMVGPYPAQKNVYRERSPLHHTEELNMPVIFFQGLDDKVVLPNQAEMMVEALGKKGVPVAYLAFEGEGHGFRQAQNIQRTLEAELYFYEKVFGMPIDPDLEPVEIENLDN
jgi:dipeptidyl aminopeptidase/acylaminoacyl peptidase